MTGLLSRVAEDVYWAARYLERAEDTARIVREYTNLIIDLPTSATPGWEPLLAILDQDHPVAQPVAAPATAPAGIDPPVGEAGRSHSSNPAPVPGITTVTGETAIVELLVSAAGNPSSIVQCVEQARQCLRRCREVIPSQAWIGVNDLHLFVASNRSDGPDRRSRIRFLDRIIADHQRLIGILATIMVRDSAFTLMRLGRHIERADMTTRLIDVQVGPLLAERPDRERTYDDHQWTGILQALSAAQVMFHRTHRHREPMAAPAVVSFILHASNFPRSVAYCLLAAREGLRTLPRAEPPVRPRASTHRTNRLRPIGGHPRESPCEGQHAATSHRPDTRTTRRRLLPQTDHDQLMRPPQAPPAERPGSRLKDKNHPRAALIAALTLVSR